MNGADSGGANSRYSVYLLYWYKSTNTDALSLFACGANSRFEGRFEKGRTVSGVAKWIYGCGEHPGAGGWYAGRMLRGLRHGAGQYACAYADVCVCVC